MTASLFLSGRLWILFSSELSTLWLNSFLITLAFSSFWSFSLVQNCHTNLDRLFNNHILFLRWWTLLYYLIQTLPTPNKISILLPMPFRQVNTPQYKPRHPHHEWSQWLPSCTFWAAPPFSSHLHLPTRYYSWNRGHTPSQDRVVIVTFWISWIY